MANLIPLTKKELEPKIQKILDRLILLFHLEDWKIYYHVSNLRTDCCAKVKQRSNLKEATITIYPRIIRDVQEEGYEEKLEDVLTHEVIHIWLWDCFMNVEDKIVENPQFLKAEEILIEDLVRILNECQA